MLPAGLLRNLLQEAGAGPEIEISLEANPGTVDRAGMLAWRRVGVNRLSLGMQSADAADLALLGRLHTYPAVVDAVRAARAGGFDNLNLDLIFGLPGQTVKSWAQSLAAALSLAPEHLSLYALTVEPGTPLAQWIKRGELAAPDPDLAADMYNMACQELAVAGYTHYEISNWALPGRRCRHNLAYWRNQAYLGAGAGAWGHWPKGESAWRLRNVAHPQRYIERMSLPSFGRPANLFPSPACAEREFIPRPLAMAETMFMGLRLLQEGVSRPAFQARFGNDPLQEYPGVLADLAQTGLVEWKDDVIRLLPEAVLVSNQVFAAFLP